MRKVLITAVALLAVLATTPTGAQSDSPVLIHTALFLGYDFAGEGVDATQVTAATAVVDGGPLTVVANPDIPRTVVANLVDANDSVSVGSVVIVGTDSNGNYATETITGIGSAAGADADASTTAFATITSVTFGTFTGEGAGDTVSIGVAASPPYSFPLLVGPRTGALYDGATGGNPDNAFQPKAPFDEFSAQPADVGSSTARIETVGWSTTIVSSTTGSSSLRWVDVGDMIKVIDITRRERILRVVTNADDDTITVDQGVDLGTAGVGYYYKKLINFNGSLSGWWNVSGAEQWTLFVDMVNITANVTYKVECRAQDANPGGPVYTVVGPTAVANGSEADFILTNTGDWTSCRLGFKFDTADGGAGDEISAYLTIRK